MLFTTEASGQTEKAVVVNGLFMFRNQAKAN